MFYHSAKDVSDVIQRLRARYKAKKEYYTHSVDPRNQKLAELYSHLLVATNDFKDEIIELNKKAVMLKEGKNEKN